MQKNKGDKYDKCQLTLKGLGGLQDPYCGEPERVKTTGAN